MPSSAGRPRASSAATLEDAAQELFLEQGYDRTTIGDIATRAGVSRNTFFNYFTCKADVLWLGFDSHVVNLGERLAMLPSDLPVTEALRRGILDLAVGFGEAEVPWAVTHAALMGTGEELSASGLSRFTQQARVLQQFIGLRAGADPDDLMPRALAFALLAAAVAAAAAWIDAGVARRPLSDYVSEAIDPICRGFGGRGLGDVASEL